jgi:hypothetical protein
MVYTEPNNQEELREITNHDILYKGVNFCKKYEVPGPSSRLDYKK